VKVAVYYSISFKSVNKKCGRREEQAQGAAEKAGVMGHRNRRGVEIFFESVIFSSLAGV
jgi:hypothetical protein